MGVFATLRAPVRCPTCGEPADNDWQFYFGAVSDLPKYVEGDEIRWDGGMTFGHPSMVDVTAVGFGGDWCARCLHPHALTSISIRNHRIVEVAFRSFEPWVREVLFVGPGRRAYLVHDGRYADEPVA